MVSFKRTTPGNYYCNSSQISLRWKLLHYLIGRITDKVHRNTSTTFYGEIAYVTVIYYYYIDEYRDTFEFEQTRESLALADGSHPVLTVGVAFGTALSHTHIHTLTHIHREKQKEGAALRVPLPLCTLTRSTYMLCPNHCGALCPPGK